MYVCFGTFSRGRDYIFTKSIIFEEMWQLTLSILLREQVNNANGRQSGPLLYVSVLRVYKKWFKVKDVTF